MRSGRREALAVACVAGLLARVTAGLLCLSTVQEQRDEALIIAIKYDDTKAVIRALHSHADPSCRDRAGKPAKSGRKRSRIRAKAIKNPVQSDRFVGEDN